MSDYGMNIITGPIAGQVVTISPLQGLDLFLLNLFATAGVVFFGWLAWRYLARGTIGQRLARAGVALYAGIFVVRELWLAGAWVLGWMTARGWAL